MRWVEVGAGAEVRLKVQVAIQEWQQQNWSAEGEMGNCCSMNSLPTGRVHWMTIEEIHVIIA